MIMSDQNNTVTTAFLSFLAGTLFGALAALLLAPSSGQELRGRIREEAEARLDELQQAQSEEPAPSEEAAEAAAS
jgi:gas vesicle protein